MASWHTWDGSVESSAANGVKAAVESQPGAPEQQRKEASDENSEASGLEDADNSMRMQLAGAEVALEGEVSEVASSVEDRGCESLDALSSDARSLDARSSGASSDSRSSGARSSDARGSVARSLDARTSGARSSDSRSSGSRSADARNSDARSSDARSSAARRLHARRPDARSSDSRRSGAQRSEASVRGDGAQIALKTACQKVEAHAQHGTSPAHSSETHGSGSNGSGVAGSSRFGPSPAVGVLESLEARMDARLEAFMRSPAARAFAAGAVVLAHAHSRFVAVCFAECLNGN